jgi:hypothetical protein
LGSLFFVFFLNLEQKKKMIRADEILLCKVFSCVCMVFLIHLGVTVLVLLGHAIYLVRKCLQRIYEWISSILWNTGNHCCGVCKWKFKTIHEGYVDKGKNENCQFTCWRCVQKKIRSAKIPTEDYDAFQVAQTNGPKQIFHQLISLQLLTTTITNGKKEDQQIETVFSELIEQVQRKNIQV